MKFILKITLLFFIFSLSVSLRISKRKNRNIAPLCSGYPPMKNLAPEILEAVQEDYKKNKFHVMLWNDQLTNPSNKRKVQKEQSNEMCFFTQNGEENYYKAGTKENPKLPHIFLPACLLLDVNYYNKNHMTKQKIPSVLNEFKKIFTFDDFIDKIRYMDKIPGCTVRFYNSDKDGNIVPTCPKHKIHKNKQCVCMEGYVPDEDEEEEEIIFKEDSNGLKTIQQYVAKFQAEVEKQIDNNQPFDVLEVSESARKETIKAKKCRPECSAEKFQTWNREKKICECKNGYKKNEETQNCEPACKEEKHQIMNSEGKCVCDEENGFHSIEGECKKCGKNQEWNPEKNNCNCIAPLIKVNNECACKDNFKEYNLEKKKCECIEGYEEDSKNQCKAKLDCGKNEIFVKETWSCDCAPSFTRNKEGECVEIHCKAENHEVYNIETGNCECDKENGYNLVNDECKQCGENQKYNQISQACDCIEGYGPNKNGNCEEIKKCLKPNQIYDFHEKKCICQENFHETLNGDCILCDEDEHKIWNSESKDCVCEDKKYFEDTTSGKCILKICDEKKNKVINSEGLCVCMDGFAIGPNGCEEPKTCEEKHTFFNKFTFKCECVRPFVEDEGNCVCPSNLIEKDNSCIQPPLKKCPVGQKFNHKTSECDCINPRIKKNNICVCPLTSHYSSVFKKCVCNDARKSFDETVGECVKRYSLISESKPRQPQDYELQISLAKGFTSYHLGKIVFNQFGKKFNDLPKAFGDISGLESDEVERSDIFYCHVYAELQSNEPIPFLPWFIRQKGNQICMDLSNKGNKRLWGQPSKMNSHQGFHFYTKDLLNFDRNMKSEAILFVPPPVDKAQIQKDKKLLQDIGEKLGIYYGYKSTLKKIRKENFQRYNSEPSQKTLSLPKVEKNEPNTQNLIDNLFKAKTSKEKNNAMKEFFSKVSIKQLRSYNPGLITTLYKNIIAMDANNKFLTTNDRFEVRTTQKYSKYADVLFQAINRYRNKKQ